MVKRYSYSLSDGCMIEQPSHWCGGHVEYADYLAAETRIRELEAAQCKRHIAMTMQMPCDACGRLFQAHACSPPSARS